jgi:23S rRNA G2069 N7-methylase RlmK/C1962 C5-methylase RlmI
VIALFAASLGAEVVVATDIDPAAIESATLNAERTGLKDAVEFRLVGLEDISAYAVIGADERFDVIISNPPYSLDLDAPGNTPAVDTGDLGMSIVQGLPRHLEPDGVALLLYNSLFYHYVMVKYATLEGYEVRSQAPNMLTLWEAETLFNAYLDRLLEVQGIDDADLRFDRKRDPTRR